MKYYEKLEDLKDWDENEFVMVPFKKRLLKYYLCAKVEPKPFVTYFISDGVFVKIGKARDIIARKHGLQTGNPNRLLIEIVIFADAESFFHTCFYGHRGLNEWFKLPSHYKEIVERLCKQNQFEYKIDFEEPLNG